MKHLGWIVLGAALVVSGCETDCDDEVETTPYGQKVEVMTCTVERTCDGKTERIIRKFPTSGSPVRDQDECDRLSGRNVFRADCEYDVELENVCIPRETRSDDGRQPGWIVGVAAGMAASSGYGDTDLGIGGAGSDSAESGDEGQGASGPGPGDT